METGWSRWRVAVRFSAETAVLLVLIGFGVVAGAQLGAHVPLRLRGAVIQWLLGAALLVLAARLLLAA